MQWMLRGQPLLRTQSSRRPWRSHGRTRSCQCRQRPWRCCLTSRVVSMKPRDFDRQQANKIVGRCKACCSAWPTFQSWTPPPIWVTKEIVSSVTYMRLMKQKIIINNEQREWLQWYRLRAKRLELFVHHSSMNFPIDRMNKKKKQNKQNE